jgi:glycosyltransferase involved in cell wall biosynthesis
MTNSSAQQGYELPALTVMMPVLNEETHLAAAVDSILSQNYPAPLELILALGPSKDSTNRIAAEIAAADKRVVLLDNPRGLTTIGLNAATKLAKYDFIVRVDAHSEPAPGYLADGMRILHETGADLLGGIMAARGRSAFQKAVAWAYTSRFGIGGAAYHVGGEAGEAESAYLGIFRKSALERVGGYDEAIIRGEDWDLAQRIKRSGGLVWFSPELSVTYWPRGNWERLAKQFYSTGVWRGDLTQRDIAGASKRYFLPPLLVLMILAGILGLVLGNPLGILPLAGYLGIVALLAVTAAGLSLKARLALMVALPTMHLSWGWGFWRGFIGGASKTVDKSREGTRSSAE